MVGNRRQLLSVAVSDRNGHTLFFWLLTITDDN
jgi:hypothetical protein